jgi:hypothetical protein
MAGPLNPPFLNACKAIFWGTLKQPWLGSPPEYGPLGIEERGGWGAVWCKLSPCLYIALIAFLVVYL